MKTFALASLVALALAGPSFAQTGAPGAPGAGGPGGPGDARRAMQERMCRDFDARLAGRIAFTEAKLQPTPAQRPAWEEFASAMRSAAAPMKELRCAAPAAPPPAGDVAARLAAREQRMTAMLNSTRTMRLAAEKLQPQLTEEQRARLAEAMNMQPGEAGMRGHHGHHGHHGGWRR